ncbi:MAG: hypothetical protein JW891_09960 [Candidatus Lokiarchaeota archaeon]|nr:hypothetical protein [Candidatus Lokiarchaeota archaeon]
MKRKSLALVILFGCLLGFSLIAFINKFLIVGIVASVVSVSAVVGSSTYYVASKKKNALSGISSKKRQKYLNYTFPTRRRYEEPSPKKLKSPKKRSPKPKITFEPERNTPEEEIQIDAERVPFTCVVHKGPIKGASFICPHCKAMYCNECAEKLEINLERCWSCNHEIRVYISDPDKIELPLQSAEQIAGDIVNSHPLIKIFTESDVKIEQIPEVAKYEFSVLREEDFKKIDSLSLSTEEKRKFMEEILWLDPDERDLILDEMIKTQHLYDKS